MGRGRPSRKGRFSWPAGGTWLALWEERKGGPVAGMQVMLKSLRQAVCAPPDWTRRFLQGAEVWERGFLQ